MDKGFRGESSVSVSLIIKNRQQRNGQEEEVVVLNLSAPDEEAGVEGKECNLSTYFPCQMLSSQEVSESETGEDDKDDDNCTGDDFSPSVSSRTRRNTRQGDTTKGKKTCVK